jgi:hypothetical protein
MDVSTFERRWGLTVAPDRAARLRQLCPVCTWEGRERCTGAHTAYLAGAGAAFDHVRWVMRGDEPGILAQPYDGLSDTAAEQLTGWCRARGLRWWALGEGCYHPSTVAVVILAGDEPPDYDDHAE